MLCYVNLLYLLCFCCHAAVSALCPPPGMHVGLCNVIAACSENCYSLLDKQYERRALNHCVNINDPI